jgi:hypothetical protein
MPGAEGTVPPTGTGGETGMGTTGAGTAGPSLVSGAGGGEMESVPGPGYVDLAVPMTQLRLRFDAAYDDNRPDRAEFFYGKCGCFRTAPPPYTDPHAPGPRLMETNVDYQDISTYIEVAPDKRWSVFAEVPVRFLNPDQNANTAGLADMNAGGKFAILYSCDQVLTAQMRVYAPTGAASHGLGTDHASLEPALLLYQRLTDRLALDAELRDWIPVGGTEFEGNVLREGVALEYLALNRKSFRVTPIAEVVSWQVLGGKELVEAGPNPTVFAVQDAAGDTIVNAKIGVRFGFGELTEPGMLSHSDLYIGYGRALTGDVWYKDILRVEYRLRF